MGLATKRREKFLRPTWPKDAPIGARNRKAVTLSSSCFFVANGSKAMSSWYRYAGK
jgi:hypothetical protein